jgi:amino acid transporter
MGKQSQGGNANSELETGLKRNSLNTWHVAILGMVAVGPAASVALNYSFITTFSGKAISLVFAGVIVVMLLMVNSIHQLSKKVVSAGSSYSFVSEGLGPRVGFMVGWIYVFAYLLFAAGGMAVFGGWAQTYVKNIFNININWVVFTLLALALIASSSYLGIQPSLKLAAIIVLVEISLIFVLAIWIIVEGGNELNSLAPFKISSSPTGINGIGLAMVYGILSLIGIETAATYGEELKDSKKNMGKSLYMGLLITGFFYILAGYAMAIGYPDFNNIVKDATPLGTLAETYWGNFGVAIVVIAVLSSIFGFSMGAFNGFVRVVYSLGRDNLFPKKLGSVHPKNGTPYISIITGVALVIIFAVPMSIIAGPFNVWGYFGFFISLGLLIVYIMTHISVYALYKKRFPSEFSFIKHFFLPAIGVLCMAFPLWFTIYPLPPMPYAIFPFLMLGWIIIGLIIMLILNKKNPAAILAARAIDQ